MTDEGFLLSPQNARDYLVEQGFMREGEEVSVQAMGGGVSNVVLLVEWAGPQDRRWVMKQSLEKLDVEADWRSERSRIYREAESIRVLRPALGLAALPEVIHIDCKRFLYIMTAAPVGSQVWKDLLLAGRTDSPVARNAGLLLAKMIHASRNDASLSSEFWDRTVFHQLRIDPYYRTTASRHPELRREFDDLIRTSLEIRTSLVHGDYSPKNFLVRGENIFLIDFEVVHWGDPSFDAAFLMNHLFLKAFHQLSASRQFIALVYDFWRTLFAALGPEGAAEFEVMTLRHLGGLMLARIDGKSPVEYIQDEATKESVRKAAIRILVERPRQLEDAIGIVQGEIHGRH
ncbi:MAG: aminoglycoside phosphotransferase family protein [Terriglobia bacterium]|jgi:5-methylthioribose kinase